MWEIHSIGDSAYLAAILNAVAMVTGTGDFRQLAAIGFALGVLLVVFQAVLSGGRELRFQNVLVAWIVYAALFGPRVSVAIEDAYSGAVRVVEHVPLGPAAVGGILSGAGYGLTRLFETAFATPRMTDVGFADTLQTLMTVRKATLSRLQLATANRPSGDADVERSFINYVAECTLAAVDIGQRTMDDILTHPDPVAALAFDSEVYTTEIYLGGAPRVETCRDAGVLLADYASGEFLPALGSALRAPLGLDSDTEVLDKVQLALDTLAGAGVDAQRYMLMAAVVPFFEKGIVRTHQDAGQWTLAASVEQAVQQRNAQWATEQSLFTRIVRPMLTFFEGFLYAVSPIMAFVVALGPSGIAMVGKYLLLGLWVQLWMPVMAVVHLYLQLAAARDLAALESTTGLALPSMYAMFRLDTLLQDYLATGGMLAASTPAISLLLVYGSAITATHLMGRLQGADHIDEKITSPDVVRPAPALAMAPAASHAPLTGTVATGAEAVLPTFQIGRDLTASVTSSQSAMQQASRAFSQSLTTSAALSSARTGESFESRALGRDYSAGLSQTDRTLRSVGETFARRYADQNVSAEQFAGLAALAAGASATVVSGRLQNQFQLEGRTAHEVATDLKQAVTGDRDTTARLARAVETDERAGVRNVFTEGLRREESESLSRQASETVSATESYVRAASLQERFGASGRYGAVETGRAIATAPALMDRLEGAVAEQGLAGDLQRLAGEWRYAQVFADREQARAAAGMALLLGYETPTFRPLEEGEAARARLAGLEILQATFGGPAAGQADPAASAWLGQPAQRAAGAPAGVGSTAPAGARVRAADLGEEVARYRREVEGRLAAGSAVVDSAGEAHAAEVTAIETGSRQGVRTGVRAELGARIQREASGMRSPAEVALNELGGLVVKSAEGISTVGDMAAGAASGFLDQVRAARSAGAPLWEAVVAGARAAPEGARAAFAAVVDGKVARARGLGLNEPQLAVYRSALTSTLPDLGPPGDGSRSAASAASEALEAAEGREMGQAQAVLLTRAATSEQDYLLRLIDQYNRAK